MRMRLTRTKSTRVIILANRQLMVAVPIRLTMKVTSAGVNGILKILMNKVMIMVKTIMRRMKPRMVIMAEKATRA